MVICLLLLLVSSLNVGLLFFTENVRTFEVSCKVILDEVVKKLLVIGLKFDTYRKYGGFLVMFLLPYQIRGSSKTSSGVYLKRVRVSYTGGV
jgi:hypothetical protein